MDKEDLHNDKKIDEKWKEAVEKEKQKMPQKPPPLKEITFDSFISSLFIEALISLGEIPNPLNNQKEENLEQAKLLVDTIAMLKEKTKGNLADNETQMLENILYELRMKYISRTTG